MANKNQKFTSKDTGVEVYNDGSARERLTATLNQRLNTGPSFEDVRASKELAVQAKVDAAPQWGAMKQLAVDVLAEAKSFAGTVAANFNNMYPDAFNGWKTQADEKFAEALLGMTGQFFLLSKSVRAASPKPSMPFPVTSPDIAAFNIRLGLLDNASPQEAKSLIEEGIQRGDLPFIVAAGVNIRSWSLYRNSWSSTEAIRIANALLDEIDKASWNTDAFASQYASDQADKYIDAWRFLVGPIAAGNYSLDASDIQTGALEPLLSPTPRKGGKKSLITFKDGEILVNVEENITDNLSDDDSGE